jgi:hypothetical protein
MSPYEHDVFGKSLEHLKIRFSRITHLHGVNKLVSTVLYARRFGNLFPFLHQMIYFVCTTTFLLIALFFRLMETTGTSLNLSVYFGVDKTPAHNVPG